MASAAKFAHFEGTRVNKNQIHLGQKCFIQVTCLWSKMPMLQRAGIRDGGEPLLLAFQHLILMI